MRDSLKKELRKEDIADLNLHTIAKMFLKEVVEQKSDMPEDFFRNSIIVNQLMDYYSIEKNFYSYISHNDIHIENITKDKHKRRFFELLYDKDKNVLVIKKDQTGIFPEYKYTSECNQMLLIEFNKNQTIDLIRSDFNLEKETIIFRYTHNYLPINKKSIPSTFGEKNTFFSDLAIRLDQYETIEKEFFDLMYLKYDYKNEVLKNIITSRFQNFDIVKENESLIKSLKRFRPKLLNIT